MSVKEYNKISTTYALSIGFDTSGATGNTSTSQANIYPEFQVRRVIFRSITTFFDSVIPFALPNSPLLVESDIFGSREVVGTCIHDDITYPYVVKQQDQQSLINLHSSFNFYLSKLTGEAVPNTLSGRMVVMLELRSY